MINKYEVKTYTEALDLVLTYKTKGYKYIDGFSFDNSLKDVKYFLKNSNRDSSKEYIDYMFFGTEDEEKRCHFFTKRVKKKEIDEIDISISISF